MPDRVTDFNLAGGIGTARGARPGYGPVAVGASVVGDDVEIVVNTIAVGRRCYSGGENRRVWTCWNGLEKTVERFCMLDLTVELRRPNISGKGIGPASDWHLKESRPGRGKQLK